MATRNKRAKNEGGLRHREDRQKWEAQFSFKGNRISKSFDTQKEASEWLNEMRFQKRMGMSAKIARMSLRQFLEFWLENRKGEIKPSTYNGYERSIRLHIPEYYAKKRVIDIQPTDICDLLTELLDEGIGPRAYNITRTTLSKAFKDSVQWGGPLANPVNGMKAKKDERKEMISFNAEEARRLIEATKDDALHMPIVISLKTGVRIGEVFAFIWSDVDFEKKTITVNRQIQRKKGEGLVFMPPKSKTSQRTIELDDGLLQQLAEYKIKQFPELAENGKTIEANRLKEIEASLVCPSQAGTPLDPCNVGKRFKKILQDLELPEGTWHTTRHSHATLLLETGVNPKVVSERLGHGSINVTLAIYAHVTTTMQEQAINAITKIFGK
jgi:integrase